MIKMRCIADSVFYVMTEKDTGAKTDCNLKLSVTVGKEYYIQYCSFHPSIVFYGDDNRWQRIYPESDHGMKGMDLLNCFCPV